MDSLGLNQRTLRFVCQNPVDRTSETQLRTTFHMLQQSKKERKKKQINMLQQSNQAKGTKATSQKEAQTQRHCPPEFLPTITPANNMR